jgi:Na+/proline symporter
MSDQHFYMIFFTIFIVINLILAVWGWLKMRKGKTGDDIEYFLGGKVTPIIVLAFSYCATSVSAGSFIGDPGFISTVGWPYYWFTVFTVPGLVIPGLFVIRRLRLQSSRYGSLSLTDYLCSRYNSSSMKIYISVVMVICYLFMLVSQYKGAALLLQSYTGIDFSTGLLIMMVAVVFFVNVGGFRSVAWTDFFQGAFMTILAAALVTVALMKIGGFTGLESSLQEVAPNYLRTYDSGPDAVFPWYSIPCIALFGFFIMFSQPYIASRYLAVPNISRKKIGQFLLITLVLGALFNAMIFLGLIGHVLFPKANPDYLTVTMTKAFFSPLLSGIMMIGFFSAMLSTASGLLLVIGQSIGSDLYAHLSKKATPRKTVWVTQASIIAAALFVLYFNMVKPPALLQVFIFLSLSGVGSMLAVPLFAGVSWRYARKEGAWCALIAGPLSYLLMDYVFHISWTVSMGLCVVPPAILMVVVSVVLNKVKGVDHKLVELHGLEAPVKQEIQHEFAK